MKELPKRKKIRLNGYDYSRTGYYFITICVKDKHEILGEIVGDDAHIVPSTDIPTITLSKFGIISDKFIKNIDNTYPDVTVDKYVIMPNHIHLILVIHRKPGHGPMRASVPTAVISNIVRSLKILVTKECGFSFWQRSYHDHIIRDEDEYRRIWQYIDENPAKWHEDCYNCDSNRFSDS